jgi:acyl carrier protein
MAEDPRAWLAKQLTSLLCCEPGQVVDAATLGQLGADSLDPIELAVAIEDSFAVKVDDEEIAVDMRVDQLVALIEAKVAAR